MVQESNDGPESVRSAAGQGADEAAKYGLIDGVVQNARWDKLKSSNIPLFPVYSGNYFE